MVNSTQEEEGWSNAVQEIYFGEEMLIIPLPEKVVFKKSNNFLRARVSSTN